MNHEVRATKGTTKGLRVLPGPLPSGTDCGDGTCGCGCGCGLALRADGTCSCGCGQAIKPQ